MAAAALGIPDHFYDANQSNLATSKTLDRPTELRFNERRQLWRDVLTDLCQWVIDRDIEATRGLLRGVPTDEARQVDLSWPDLLEPDVVARVGAVVDATTLAGREPAGTISQETTSRLLLSALNVENIDEELARVEAERAEREAKAKEIAQQMQRQPPAQPGQPTPPQPPGSNSQQPATEGLAEAAKALRVTEEDLLAAAAWFDQHIPTARGLLAAEVVDDEPKP